MSNIKQKTINNMAWSMAERFSLQMIHVVISIVLARLLSPSEFGLFGMLAIFTSVAQSILDSGFGSALIQKKDASQTDSSSIFFFNLFIGILLAGIFFISAPLIAAFFEQPILKPITRALSLTLIINAFSLVQLSMLRKRMSFKNLFIINIIAAVVSGICGILAAYFGMGVWSLVVQSITYSLSQALSVWFLGKWRPLGGFSLDSLRSMVGFGSRLLVAGLIETIFKHLYQTFIGKVYSPSDVGYYSRATTMESAASVATSMAVGQVIFSAFSPYQDDNNTLYKVHDKTINMTMFLIMPVMIGLMAVAEPLFLFLLTEKWKDSIIYFQLLCISGMLLPIAVQNYNLMRIKGRTDLHLRLEIFKYLLTILAIAVTYKHGILILIYGQIAVVVISHFVVSYFIGRLVDYSIGDQLKTIFPHLITSLAMGVFLFFIGRLNIPSNFIKFSTQILVGIPVYFLLNKLIKSPELDEFITIARSFINQITSKMKGD